MASVTSTPTCNSCGSVFIIMKMPGDVKAAIQQLNTTEHSGEIVTSKRPVAAMPAPDAKKVLQSS